MQGTHILLEEPIQLASILEPTQENFFLVMTKKLLVLFGPQSRSIEVIEECLKAGMVVAWFDFSRGDNDYRKETIENLKIAAKEMNKLWAIMLDTVGPELRVFKRSEEPVVLEIDVFVTRTLDWSYQTKVE